MLTQVEQERSLYCTRRMNFKLWIVYMFIYTERESYVE